MSLFSLSPLTVLPCSPVEQIEAAARAGFDAVGLRVTPTMDTDIDVMADRGLRAKIRRRLQSTGLKVLDIEVVRLHPDLDAASYEGLLEFAGALGAGWLSTTGTDHYGTQEEPRVVERLAELCGMASQYEMGVMVEFQKFRSIRTLEDAKRIVTAANQPNAAINFDVLHFQRSGGQADDLAMMDPALLACVQLCDGPAVPPQDLAAEGRYERLLPGTGELPLGDYMAALPAGIPVSVEVPSVRRQNRSVDERAQEAAEATRRFLSQHGRNG